ncbi:MAG: hypothetical protein M0Q13_05945 [Methanothrix sp.]|nr:hypothetical protein [Methanothrix sp.]
MGLFDNKTPEEKDAERIARFLKSRTCPFAYAGNYPLCSGERRRWWSLKGNECYVLLACKKILGEP